MTSESTPINADSSAITLKTTPYRLAAGMLVIQAIPQMMWHGATWSWTAIVFLSFRLIVVLGLAGSQGWARTLALGFAVFGAILAPAMFLDAPPLQALLRTLGTWAFCGALIILLYGRSTTRRIWLAAGVFTIGFCIDLWLFLASWSEI